MRIHPLIGQPLECLGLLSFVGKDRQAKASTALGETGLLQLLNQDAQVFAQSKKILPLYPWQQCRKLVVSDSVHLVFLSQGFAQQSGEAHDQPVPLSVPLLVVDLLESVQVGNQQS